MPNVTFHIQGQEFPLPPSAYTIQVHVSCPLPGFVSNLPYISNPGFIPCSFRPTAADPASLQRMITCGSWVTSSSDITTPYSAEARAGWVWPRLNDPAEASLSVLVFCVLLHDVWSLPPKSVMDQLCFSNLVFSSAVSFALGTFPKKLILYMFYFVCFWFIGWCTHKPHWKCMTLDKNNSKKFLKLL